MFHHVRKAISWPSCFCTGKYQTDKASSFCWIRPLKARWQSGVALFGQVAHFPGICMWLGKVGQSWLGWNQGSVLISRYCFDINKIFLSPQWRLQTMRNLSVLGHLLMKKWGAGKTPVYTDIGKTFGPLPDRRTGNHMENPSFTGAPKLLQDLI